MEKRFKIFQLQEISSVDKYGDDFTSITKTEMSSSFESREQAEETVKILLEGEPGNVYVIDPVYIHINYVTDNFLF